MLGLHTFRQKKAGVVKREPRNSDSVVWTDLLGLIRHLFPLSDNPPPCKAGVSVLAKILLPNVGVKAVPEIFGADGPKITQRPPRPRAHNHTIEKGQQRATEVLSRFVTKNKKEMSLNIL